MLEKQGYSAGAALTLATEMARHLIRWRYGKNLRWIEFSVAAESSPPPEADAPRYTENRSFIFHVSFAEGPGFWVECHISRLHWHGANNEWWEPRWGELGPPSSLGSLEFLPWEETGGRLMLKLEKERQLEREQMPFKPLEKLQEEAERLIGLLKDRQGVASWRQAVEDTGRRMQKLLERLPE